MFRAYISCLLLLVTINSWAQQSAQTSPADQSLAYSVQVELSQLALRITDKNGNWIGGVKKEDLQLFEDGVPQEILYWDEIGKEPEQEKASPQTHPLEEKALIPAAAAATPPNNILLIFDACNSGQIGFEKHKKYVKEFLQN